MRNSDGLALGLIAGFGLYALAVSLSHPFIPLWDEAMHQAAARGTLDTPAYPHIYAEHLVAQDPRDYWLSEAWLNKPPAPFWFGAAVMRVIGVTPLALRLVSLLATLVAAGVIYLLARTVAGRVPAVAAAIFFLSLPFGWLLVQGLLFGDVTDCTLAGCNALAVGLVVLSAQRQSWKLSVAAGAVVGLGVLCKVMLALTPLGLAVALWLLSLAKVTQGPRLRWLAAMFGAAALICVPWNVYAAAQWPDVYWMHARTWLGHLLPIEGMTAPIGSWQRPIDAIFNEINAGELRPVPPALSLLAGLWLLAAAIRRRQLVTISVAIWLWGTWAVLSYSAHKVPATAWGAVPAVVIGLALLFRDGVRLPPLGFAAVAALCTPLALKLWPGLGAVRQALPAFLEQTRALPGLAEGVCLAVLAAALGGLLQRLLRGVPRAALALPTAVGALALLAQTHQARVLIHAENAHRLWASHTREVGLAIDQATPKKSVLFLDIERDMPESSEVLSQIFWAGRMTYRSAPDLPLARARGYHPYLVSPAAEAFEPVPGVPPSAWLRAYDLERPTRGPAPLPEGVTMLTATLERMTVHAVAAGWASARQDRWAFYVESFAEPEALHVIFHTTQGRTDLRIAPTACLRDGRRLAGAAWFILPTLGPKRRDVRALEFDRGGRIPLPDLGG